MDETGVCLCIAGLSFAACLVIWLVTTFFMFF